MSKAEPTFQLPTDRGFAVIRSRGDGTKDVMVCDGVSAGQPRNVYATHFKVRALKIHPRVRLEHTGDASSTTQIVEVSSDRPGEVHIRVPSHGLDLVREAEALRS